ncbi:MBL fold metallo-hydrolase [Pseudoroseicyclus tamaricis]|uniref:MBL fold metallo-hydrolase n=1 Tax=Pseudoroseicyclus tamaricis TaxID=2705421 RepID=A0A6B2JW28_9RHOB|nr:MBL fold metallo-hydrolase [Pseudoroseicyclus tamaricis]NDV02488.1 MBL fold metallo-hydrolase [Pseudoroseicyclus tamaricis]
MPHRSFTIGEIDVTVINAAAFPTPEPHKTFGQNVDADAFAAAAQADFVAADTSVSSFSPVVVTSAGQRLLFDTGLNPEQLLAALSEAGLTAGDIDVVVLTHMHGDHVGGLAGEDGTPTFPHATYITGRAEWDHWAKADYAPFEGKVRPLEAAFTFIEPGAEVAPGVTALEAHGHTPGHMAFMVESGGLRLLMMVDTANHHVFSLAHPDWVVGFDSDKDHAAATRHRLLGMAADERLPVIGYHMPFPCAGFVERRGEGFRWIPVTYQL